MRRLLGALPARYLLRKLLGTLLLLWGVATLVFLILEISPGTPMDRIVGPDTPPELRQLLVAKYGLDRPLPVRYLAMIRNLAVGDLGVSLVSETPVSALIADRLPWTLLLSGITLATLFPFGIAVGTLQALRQGRPTDTILSVVLLVLYSMPVFWLALLLQLWAPSFGLPGDGACDPVMCDLYGWGDWTRDVALHMILPGVAMGLSASAGIARFMRSSLLEVIRQDYVRTARAKGLSEARVLLRHALPNALLPVVTLLGLYIPRLVGGSVLVETVFALPGMGRLILTAIQTQDTPLLIGCFMLFALVVALANLVTDVLYAVLDPRIRYA